MSGSRETVRGRSRRVCWVSEGGGLEKRMKSVHMGGEELVWGRRSLRGVWLWGGLWNQHTLSDIFVLLNLSEPQFLHQQNGIITPTRQVCSLNETEQAGEAQRT